MLEDECWNRGVGLCLHVPLCARRAHHPRRAELLAWERTTAVRSQQVTTQGRASSSQRLGVLVPGSCGGESFAMSLLLPALDPGWANSSDPMATMRAAIDDRPSPAVGAGSCTFRAGAGAGAVAEFSGLPGMLRTSVPSRCPQSCMPSLSRAPSHTDPAGGKTTPVGPSSGHVNVEGAASRRVDQVVAKRASLAAPGADGSGAGAAAGAGGISGAASCAGCGGVTGGKAPRGQCGPQALEP
mmetsp:Transcript_32843/g.79772  ORF Transcript_32843/g.79772 Transcript_32843/m.79772 type:complete len:241 (-) Transcript_32843:1373-2095(-)